MVRLGIAAALVSAIGCDAGGGAGAASGGMSLREALLSTPEAIAALPLEQRMALAMRMEEAIDAQRAFAELEAADDEDVPALTIAFDAPRIEAGDDAVLALIVERSDAAAALHTLASIDPDGGVVAAPLERPLARISPSLDEEPARTAIAGRAGETLARMARETGATEIVVAPSMPAAAVGDASRIHVNPVWLSLLALLDTHESVGAARPALIGDPPPPVGHHETESEGWGCYSGGVDCDVCSSTCSCGYCGLDCGSCACECGDDADGLVHCTTARPRRRGSPFDGLWLLAPVAYLLFRRRRG